MIKKLASLFFALFVFEGLQICAGQNLNEKISLESMPAFVKELQQELPSAEIMRSNPELYQHLLKRRLELSLLLIKAVNQHQLPESALQFLQPQHAVEGNTASSNSFTGKTTEGNFHLVKDINQSKNSYPSNNNYYYPYPDNYAVLNKIIYYSADDGIHGTELWRSNGTDTGTYMVKNIAPGNASGYPRNITVFNNKIYFAAFNQGHGYELYQSDGTAPGTSLLKGVNAGISDVSDLTAANDKLYFVTYQSELWKTDGTTNGTVLIKNLYKLNAFNLQQLVSVNDNVFFTASDYSHGTELWRSDGMAAGTYMVKDINPDSSQFDYNGPMNLTSYNGKLYFSAYDGHARTLWKSDGTLEGTKNVIHNDIQVMPNPSISLGDDKPYAIAKGALYFAGYTASTGIDLYKYNFNTASMALVKTISSSKTNASFFNESIRSMNDSIYFLIPNAANTGYDLWKSGGASTSTKIIRSFTGIVNRYNFYAAGKMLYFSISSTENGNEPWISDGTSKGTQLLKDINNGVSSSNPSGFTLCNAKIYFSAYSPAGGIELWKTDGTTINTKQVKDINITSSASAVNQLISLNTKEIIFPAYVPDTGTELWKSDGTEAGTALVKDLTPGEASSNLIKFYSSKNGKAYFTLYNDTTTFSDIYITDGSASGTKRIATLTGSVSELQVADNGVVFYVMYDYHTGDNQLWRTDNTGNNFRLSLNVSNLNGDEIGVSGNICYFSVILSGTSETDLWKSDGTVSGTKIISNNIHDSYWYTPFGNKIVFMANSFSQYGMWISDGTAAGTVFLKNIFVNINAGTAILNNKLYFNGSGDLKGNELYKTDGTPAGTKLIKDINVGQNNSSPANFTTVKNSVFFTAIDKKGQTGLWKTSGTDAGTKLIKVLSPHNLETHDINNFISAGSKLYFIDSTQLWVSDGTETGTHVIIDPADITSVTSLAALGNNLFYAGYSYEYGSELYIGDASSGDLKSETKVIAKALNKPALSVQLINNPFINNIRLSIISPQNQQIKIVVNNTAGQILINNTLNVSAGNNLISLNGNKWAHGMYMLSIVSGSDIVSLKAIK